MATHTLKSQKRLGDDTRLLLGFRNRYDFFLWAFFGGILVLFCLVRTQFLHPPSIERNIGPGEWYWMGQQPYKFGIFLHLWTILPAGLLCVTQFVPKIRDKAMLVHRFVGYVVIILVFISILGSLIIARHSFGGDPATQIGLYTLACMTNTAMFLAWWNIRKLQIDQHRRWMIRAMVWMSQIITLRILMIIGMGIVYAVGGRHTIWTCDEALYVVKNLTLLQTEFPQCRLLGPDTLIGVPMDVDSYLHVGSIFRGVFAPSLWLAIVLHVTGVEIYLAATSAESDRLRIVSYYKQRAAGMKPHAHDRPSDVKPGKMTE